MTGFEKLKNKLVLLYGAGAIARVILPYLLHNENVHVLGIAVSHTAENTETEIQKIPVKPVSEYKDFANNAVILIATSEQYHAAIGQACKESGFQNIVPLTPALKDEIILSYYRAFFEGKGVLLDGDVFSVDTLQFLNPCTQHFQNGVNLFSQLGDLVFPHIYNDWNTVVEGPYDWQEVSLKTGDVVLDCGANMGVFSVYAAAKGCTVYAFEPTPGLHPILTQHAKLNQGQIMLESYAVSNQTGATVFHLDPYSCGGSSLLVRSTNTVELEVQQLTVDEFVQQRKLKRVDFIKADIEGAERLMLEGAHRTLAEFAPKLSICTYHLPDDKEVLTELILAANPNYKIKYHWQKLYAYV